jgi:protein CpxP
MKALQIPNLIRIGAVATALALGGVAAHAGAHGHHRGGPAMMVPGEGLFAGRMGHMLELVNATEAQRSQIKAIFKAAQQDLAGQRDSGRKLHEQLAALYMAPNIDAAAIESVRAQISAQRETAAKRMSQASIEAARVLTPEQRAKIGETLAKRKARMAERAAEHGGRR